MLASGGYGSVLVLCTVGIKDGPQCVYDIQGLHFLLSHYIHKHINSSCLSTVEASDIDVFPCSVRPELIFMYNSCRSIHARLSVYA